MGSRTTLHPSTYMNRPNEHKGMSYLLSSVDLVLFCATIEPTHAPTVVSLAPSTGAVFASSLGSLRIVRFLILLHRVTPHTAAALLFASVSMLFGMVFFLCTFELISSGEQFN
jgi:hypothetical protein